MLFAGSDNHAPVLGSGTYFPAVMEDDFENTGKSVADYLGGAVTDVDPGALSGIAVDAVEHGPGAWQYSLDGGATWRHFGSLEQIAPVTRKGQIPGGIVRDMLLGHDMLNMKGDKRCGLLRHVAILASVTSAAKHELSCG